MKYPITRIAGTLVASSVLAITTAGAATVVGTYKIDALGHNVLHKMGSTMMTDYAKGTVTVNTNTNKLCSELVQRGLGMVTSADVNVGAVGKDGPSVAMLNVAQINHKSMQAACVTITHMLANEIRAHPRNYYVIVANAQHPHGAVRSQL